MEVRLFLNQKKGDLEEYQISIFALEGKIPFKL